MSSEDVPKASDGARYLIDAAGGGGAVGPASPLGIKEGVASLEANRNVLKLSEVGCLICITKIWIKKIKNQRKSAKKNKNRVHSNSFRVGTCSATVASSERTNHHHQRRPGNRNRNTKDTFSFVLEDVSFKYHTR